MKDSIQLIRTWLDHAGELTETLLNAISLFFIVVSMKRDWKKIFPDD